MYYDIFGIIFAKYFYVFILTTIPLYFYFVRFILKYHQIYCMTFLKEIYNL